jgi:hypothetical protein
MTSDEDKTVRESTDLEVAYASPEPDGGIGQVDEGYAEVGKSGKRGRKTREGKDVGPAVWLTDGSPPELYKGVESVILELSRIRSNDSLQSLVDLARALLSPSPLTESDADPLSLDSLVAACVCAESRRMLGDFRHFILLIRLAFHLER